MDMRKSGVVSGSDSGAFTDLNRLNNLKVGDRESDANMRKVAQEFESLFLNEMLKSMRSANEVLGKDNPLNTPAAKQYQEMYDQQLSVTLSRQGGGIGLADVLMRQMSKNKSAVPGESAVTTALTAEVKTPAATPAVDSPFVRSSGQRPLWASRVAIAPDAAAGGHKNDMAMLNQRRLALPTKLTDRLLAGIVPSADPARSTLNTGAVPERTSPGPDAVLKGGRQPMLSASGAHGRMQIYGRAVAQPPLAPAKQAFSSPDAFVATMLPMAQQAADRIGVDPLYLVAQAALETGWGKSVMRQQDGSSSHNLFGIKAPATGRVRKRGPSPVSSRAGRWSRRRRTSVPTIPIKTASTIWSRCCRATIVIKKYSTRPINRSSLYVSCRRPVTQPTLNTRARFLR